MKNRSLLAHNSEVLESEKSKTVARGFGDCLLTGSSLPIKALIASWVPTPMTTSNPHSLPAQSAHDFGGSVFHI